MTDPALVSDRNRADLRWLDRGFSVRYRNRVQLEKPFPVLDLFYGYHKAYRPKEEKAGAWGLAIGFSF